MTEACVLDCAVCALVRIIGENWTRDLVIIGADHFATKPHHFMVQRWQKSVQAIWDVCNVTEV